MDTKYTYRNDAKAAMRQLREKCKVRGIKPTVRVDIGWLSSTGVIVNFKQVQQVIDGAIDEAKRLETYEWIEEVWVEYTINVWSLSVHFSAKVGYIRNDQDEDGEEE
jgi:hypothetical protein